MRWCKPVVLADGVLVCGCEMVCKLVIPACGVKECVVVRWKAGENGERCEVCGGEMVYVGVNGR